MRVFLSTFEKFRLAIPIEMVSSVMINRGNAPPKNSISLPQIFKNENLNTRHGVILKNSNYILLVTRIDCETDITDKDIFTLPRTLGVSQLSRFINGIKFLNGQLILFLNPEILTSLQSGFTAKETL